MICLNNAHVELSRDGDRITLTITQTHPVGWSEDEIIEADSTPLVPPMIVTLALGPKEAEHLIGALMVVAEHAREARCRKL